MATRLQYMDGLQHPCRTCGACCRDAAGAKYVSEDEERAIARLGHTNFSMRDPLLGFRSLRSESGACVFYDPDGSQCRIYENRPFDCRAFPYDIVRSGDEYYWIKWGLAECSLFALLDDARELEILERTALLSFREDLPLYADYTDSMLARHPGRQFTVLRPVALSGVRSGERDGCGSSPPLPAGLGSFVRDR